MRISAVGQSLSETSDSIVNLNKMVCEFNESIFGHGDNLILIKSKPINSAKTVRSRWILTMRIVLFINFFALL